MSEAGNKIKSEFGDAVIDMTDLGEARIEVKVAAEKMKSAMPNLGM